jgi:hypothetical protein
LPAEGDFVMSAVEGTSGGDAAQTLVHCASCSTRKPMVIKQLVFRVTGDKVIYQCAECGAEIELPAMKSQEAQKSPGYGES